VDPRAPRPPGDSVQRLFELSVDMLGTASVDGYFTRLNPAWERTLGWTCEELMAEPFLTFVHPDDVESTMEQAAKLAASDGSTVVAFENRYRTRDGDYRAIEWTVVSDGGVFYFVAKDVTARQAIERERDQAASIAQAMTDGVADGLSVSDSDGTIVYVNASGLRMLGYEADELTGRDWHLAVHHSHPDGTPYLVEDCPLHAARAAGASYETADDCFWRKDGSMLPVAYSSSPVPLANGAGSVVVFRDISEQRAATADRQEAGVANRRSEMLHHTLTANLPDTSVFLLDHDLRILVADGETIRRLPWVGQDTLRGRKVAELHAQVPDEVLQLSLENYTAALQGERREFEFSSEGLTFSVQAVPVRGDDGSIESALVVARDITERTLAQHQIVRRASQQKAVAELGRFALESDDLNALMREAVTIATTTLGVELGAVLALDEAGGSLTVVAGVGIPPDAIGAHRISLNESANAGFTLRTGEPTIIENMATETRFKPYTALLELGAVSSVCVPIGGRSQPFGVLDVYTREPRVFSEDEVAFLAAVAGLIVVAVERHGKEQATQHAALHDPLTGLPNRALALDRLAHALARRQREGIDVAVFVLDLDRFKTINDSFGHAAGDEVLLALAPRLTAAVRVTDTVARLGGDEFVVICPEVDAVSGVTDVTRRLAAAVAHPLIVDSGEHFFTVSTGIALAATGNDTPASLLGDADAAVYRAKERGRGHSVLFDEAMRTSAMARVHTETELRRALDRGELEVFYQPVVDLATGQPVSTEALVRWMHPERGLIPPLEFIPIAEETGLIAELGLQVLEQACAQTAAWQRDIDPAIGVSVNVSGRQAVNPVFPAQVAAIADRAGLGPGTLSLEITETVLMEEADSPDTVIDDFQEHGLILVLDDFGTGYSSLGRLKRFPLDVLKIDRSFVDGIENNIDDRAIVMATIDMAHAVGMTVVAEGVETHEQEASLRAFGCDRAQGFLYARPQRAAAITDVLAAAARSREAPAA
jgi:diguanylate cyclase (GGDEF)-like protein/PAS domain S-box-containing protein